MADLVEGLGDLATPHPLILGKKKIAEESRQGRQTPAPSPSPFAQGLYPPLILHERD